MCALPPPPLDPSPMQQQIVKIGSNLLHYYNASFRQFLKERVYPSIYEELKVKQNKSLIALAKLLIDIIKKQNITMNIATKICVVVLNNILKVF
jgi:hypothetical protein